MYCGNTCITTQTNIKQLTKINIKTISLYQKTTYNQRANHGLHEHTHNKDKVSRVTYYMLIQQQNGILQDQIQEKH